jgi:hypothetical protein
MEVKIRKVIGDEAGGNGYKKRVDRMGRMGLG